jgi:HAD superfamily hydrolase (TIGR01450 family)
MTLPIITMRALIARYDAIMFDAYGVLVRGDGAIEGAGALIAHLHAIDKPYVILTNDASRLTETCAARYAALGVPIPVERIVTSGSLLVPYFAQHGLAGARTLVLGGADAQEWVRRAGGLVLEPGAAEEADVLALADLPDEAPMAQVEAVLSALLRALDHGCQVRMVLPNPDRIYPRSTREVGITGGGVAHMIEGILAERYPGRALGFDRLGKPYAMIFEEGKRRLPQGASLVMVGDQLATDVRGALDAGIDAALVPTGLIRDMAGADRWPVKPTWLLASALSLEA